MRTGRRPSYYREEEKYANKILEAVTCGSIGMAARRIGVTPTTLRRQIHALGLNDKVDSVVAESKNQMASGVLSLARQGLGDNTIAVRLGIPESRVKRIRIENGLLHRRGSNDRLSKHSLRARMMSDLSKTYSYAEIADAFGCSRQNVHQVVSAWEHNRHDQGEND